jgi:hypothetical protein
MQNADRFHNRSTRTSARHILGNLDENFFAPFYEVKGHGLPYQCAMKFFSQVHQTKSHFVFFTTQQRGRSGALLGSPFRI